MSSTFSRRSLARYATPTGLLLFASPDSRFSLEEGILASAPSAGDRRKVGGAQAGEETRADSRNGSRLAGADAWTVCGMNGCDSPDRSPDAGQGCRRGPEWLAASLHYCALRRRGVHGTTRAPQADDAGHKSFLEQRP